MINQISFTPEWSSNRNNKVKPNQLDDSDTGSDKDMDNLSLLTPERSSNPNSTIKRNQSYDSDIVSDKAMALLGH